MNCYRRKPICLFFATIGFFYLLSSYPVQSAEISAIEVKGNRRIESSTVLAYLPLRVGEPYDAAAVDQALKTLFATGLFSDIKIEQRGTKLVVVVSENPIINIVTFEGNDTIEDDALTPLISLGQRSVYNRSKVLLAAQTIAQQYRRQGYYAVRVEPQIIELDQYRVNIVFNITEGVKNYVEAISFLGNEVFSDGDLRGAIATTEYQFWKFLSVTDTYDPDRLEFDKQLLRGFYTRRGYADFNVEAVLAERNITGDGFYITFVISEGRRYRFGKSEFNIQIPGVRAESFEPLLEYKTGALFDGLRIGKSLDAINDAAQELGYAFIEISPDLKYDRERSIVRVVWRIAEAPRTYVERIDISGNTHTEDQVVRREFRLEEGDVYNRTLIARSERFIRTLGFFDNVVIETRQGSSPDKIVLDARVAERPTGEISLGVGYSTIDGFLGDFSIRENNFQGKGQTLEAAFTYATRNRGVNFLFSEPYLFGYRLSLTTNFFYRLNDFQDTQGYNLDRLGGSISVRFPLREDFYLTMLYELSNERVHDVIVLGINEGETIESIIGYRLTYDRRDDVREPSDGWLAQAGQDIAGVGGQARYLRSTIDIRSYFTLADTVSGKYIFASRLSGGHLYPLGGFEAGTQYNFFLGAGNLRGFDRSGAGPRDSAGISRGGRLYGILSNELRISSKILRQIGLTPILFLDTAIIGDSGEDVRNILGAANVNDNFGLRMSAGFSLLWESPLGPLRFDFADVLLKEDYDIEQNFNFQIGVSF